MSFGVDSIPPPLNARRSKRSFIGIDPGFSGAIGVVDERGQFVLCYDIPLRGAAEGKGREYNTPKLVKIVEAIARFCPAPEVFLEWPQTRPDEAPESSKRFGVGMGTLEGVFTAFGMEPRRIAPNLWKGRMGLDGKDKDAVAARNQAVTAAEQFIKGIPKGHLRGVRGGAKDGRAEALLIGWWAMSNTMDGLRNMDPDVRLAKLVFGTGRRRRRPGNL